MWVTKNTKVLIKWYIKIKHYPSEIRLRLTFSKSLLIELIYQSTWIHLSYWRHQGPLSWATYTPEQVTKEGPTKDGCFAYLKGNEQWQMRLPRGPAIARVSSRKCTCSVMTQQQLRIQQGSWPWSCRLPHLIRRAGWWVWRCVCWAHKHDPPLLPFLRINEQQEIWNIQIIQCQSYCQSSTPTLLGRWMQAKIASGKRFCEGLIHLF